MYAVIFRAEINELDDKYAVAAAKLRDLALNEYGCIEVIAMSEGNNELTISYWNNEKSIKQWKANSEHIIAQSVGQTKWYKNYHIQIVKLVREYGSE